MKKYKDMHMLASVALLVGVITSLCSEIAKHKLLHVIGFLLTGAGTGICIYSGHKILCKDLTDEAVADEALCEGENI